MKYAIVTLMATFVAASAIAQGTVNFANNTSTPLIDGRTGQPTQTTDEFTIGLWWGPVGGELTQAVNADTDQVATAENRGAPPPVLAGQFNGGKPLKIKGAAESAQIAFEVRVWDTATGEAMFGSGAGTVMTGGGTAPAGNLFGAGEGQIGSITIEVVPEPTSFALAGLGAAALMIFRRRK